MVDILKSEGWVLTHYILTCEHAIWRELSFWWVWDTNEERQITLWLLEVRNLQALEPPLISTATPWFWFPVHKSAVTENEVESIIFKSQGYRASGLMQERSIFDMEAAWDKLTVILLSLVICDPLLPAFPHYHTEAFQTLSCSLLWTCGSRCPVCTFEVWIASTLIRPANGALCIGKHAVEQCAKINNPDRETVSRWYWLYHASISLLILILHALEFYPDHGAVYMLASAFRPISLLNTVRTPGHVGLTP